MAEHCLSEARRLGFRAMQFNYVISTNTAAIRLWQDLGFEIVGTLPDAFHHPDKGYVDVYVMYSLCWRDALAPAVAPSRLNKHCKANDFLLNLESGNADRDSGNRDRDRIVAEQNHERSAIGEKIRFHQSLA
jgi:hypothetical protein